jgi:hypothetical protein
MSPAGFETTISAGERPQTYSLDRAATGTDVGMFTIYKILLKDICFAFIRLDNKLYKMRGT